MLFLLPDQLVLTDHMNESVKMVDTSSRSITADLQLLETPWDLTLVTGNELAVTLS